jgi:hypothetical protein
VSQLQPELWCRSHLLMIQNRTNRALLFGGRPSFSAGDASTDALEIENQRSVDRLGGSTSMMKDVAIAIEADVADQNRLLDRVDKRFDSSVSVVDKTLSALNEMVTDRTGARLCYLVGGFFGVLFITYVVLRSR